MTRFLALLVFTFLQVKAEETINVHVTGYGWPDNDDGGNTKQDTDAIAHPRGARQSAGGEGTYDNPITVAAKKGAFPIFTKFYVPHLKRYFLLEDDCASCKEDHQLDVWVGGKGADKVAVNKCEECISRTEKRVPAIVNPGSGYDVKKGSIYGSKGCDQGIACEN